MANQHTSHPSKITLPAIPGLTSTTAPRMTPLEAAQARRAPEPKPVVDAPAAEPVKRAPIGVVPVGPILRLLRKGPMTAAAIAAAIDAPTKRVSTTLRNARKQGQVIVTKVPPASTALWSLAGHEPTTNRLPNEGLPFEEHLRRREAERAKDQRQTRQVSAETASDASPATHA